MLKAIITTLSIFFFYTVSIFSQCAITDLALTPSDCDNDGNYDLTINFNTQNPGNTFFDLSINGELYEFFPLADLPITIENFPDGGLTVPFVTVCINDNPDCCFENEFVAPDCNNNGCELDITVIELHECDADGNFLVDFEIEYSGQGDEGFTVFGNGMNYGNFVYGETFYTVGPFAGNGTSVYEIIIQDLEVADCQTFTGFDALDCNNNGCELDITVIELHDCDADGNFLVDFEIEYSGQGNEGFTVFGNGMNYGNFVYGESFYTVGPFAGNGTSVYEIIIQDLEVADCQTFTGFDALDCTIGGDCAISDMELTPSDCDGDGNYDLTINFIAQNPNNTFFDLSINGELYEFYPLADLPITIENFPDGGLTVPFVTVCINDNPDCCFENEFPAPDCDNNDCELDITAIELHECDADGNFLVDFEIEYSGQGNEGFTVFGNGMNYGNFEYGETFYTVGPFAGNGTSVYEIIIQDLEVADCQTFTGFDALDCGGNDCELDITAIELYDCDDDGNFLVDFAITYSGQGDEGFTIFGNGINYGNFEYGETFYTVGPFPGNGNSVEIIIQDLEVADCQTFTGFNAPDCGGNEDCQITNTFIEYQPCNGDGQFFLHVGVEVENPVSSTFNIFGNGQNYGNFPYGQSFYEIGPFDGNPSAVYELIFVDEDNLDCQTEVVFESIDCGIENLVWPGDLNNDNIANNLDLLNLGLAFNSTGEPRDMQGIEWSALPATEWDFAFANGVNYVFADANGDGTADADDQNAIEVNYDLTHGDVVENYDEAGNETDPELFVDLPNADLITIGEPFTAPIILGTDDIPVSDIYGLAFTLVFDPAIIDPENVEIDFSTNWMGQSGVNVLTLAEKLAIGEVDMVLTKNDQNNVGGFGQIAAFIGIIDNIAGKTEVEIQIKNVRAINRGEETVFLQRPIDMIEVTVSTSSQLTNNDISIYPNPTMDELIIANSQHLPMTAVEIRNAAGKLVAIFENGDKKMDVSSLPSGVYLLNFEIGGRMYFERFIKM